MCRKCAEKAKAEILITVAASGVRANARGCTGICVVSHHNHSHYRLRQPDGTPVGNWAQANCALPFLLRALVPRDWAVHRHDEAEMFPPKKVPGLEAKTKKKLQSAQQDLALLAIGEKGEAPVCTICLEPCRPGSGARAKNPADYRTTLPCGHTFHAHCIREWLGRATGCPTCRDEITSKRIAGAKQEAKKKKKRMKNAAGEFGGRVVLARSKLRFAPSKLGARVGAAFRRLRLPSLGRKKN